LKQFATVGVDGGVHFTPVHVTAARSAACVSSWPPTYRSARDGDALDLEVADSTSVVLSPSTFARTRGRSAQ
jgi:hypothetical protein